jgi:hypothetical protein
MSAVCLSALNTCPPNGRIFIKFDILGFFESLPRKFKFEWNRNWILYMNINIYICHNSFIYTYNEECFTPNLYIH